MKHLNVPDVQSGSEKCITPEDKWCLANCQWSDDEPTTSTTRATVDAMETDAEIAEDDEDSEDSDDGDSDDSLATCEELY